MAMDDGEGYGARWCSASNGTPSAAGPVIEGEAVELDPTDTAAED
jgi:hypothetical protein